MKVHLRTLLALVFVTLLGMPLSDIVTAVEEGSGGMLASMGLIFGLGAILGKLIADAGGARRIAITLINKFGKAPCTVGCCYHSFYIGNCFIF